MSKKQSPYPIGLTSLLTAAKEAVLKREREKEKDKQIKKDNEEKERKFKEERSKEEQEKINQEIKKSQDKTNTSGLNLTPEKKLSYNKTFQTKAGDVTVNADRKVGSPDSKASVKLENEKVSAGGSYDWKTKKSNIDAEYRLSKDAKVTASKKDKDVTASYKDKNVDITASKEEGEKVKTSGNVSVPVGKDKKVTVEKDEEGNKSVSYDEGEESGRSISVSANPKNKITGASGEYTTKKGTAVRGSVELDESSDEDEEEETPTKKAQTVRGSVGTTIKGNKYDVSFDDKNKAYSASTEIGGNEYGISYDKSKGNLLSAKAAIGNKDFSASYSPTNKSAEASAEIGKNKYGISYSPGSFSANTQIGGNKYRLGYTPSSITGGATIGRTGLNFDYNRENKGLTAGASLNLGRSGTVTGAYSPNLLSAAYETPGGSKFNFGYDKNEKRFNVGANVNLNKKNESDGSYGAKKAKELNKMVEDEKKKKKA